MMSKVVGIFVSMLILFSFGTMAEYIDTEHPPEITGFSDDVPEWHVGDSWTYTIDDFTVDFVFSGQKIFIDGSIDDFKWTVEDTSGSTYRVGFTGKFNGRYEIFLSSSSGKFYIVGTVKDTLTSLIGEIIFTQSNLELRDMSGELKGITWGKISPLPFALPLPFKATIDGDLSTEFPLFDFPLYVPKFWNFPDMQATMRIRAGGIFGLLQIPMSISVDYPWIPLAFYCKDQRDITVEAGIFNAYEISSLFGQFFEYYYAPTVGNLIKIDAVMDNGDVHGELKSYDWAGQ
jgi:hypothetical protein